MKLPGPGGGMNPHLKIELKELAIFARGGDVQGKAPPHT